MDNLEYIATAAELGINVDGRQIYLFGTIKGDMALRLRLQLTVLEAISAKRAIKVLIHSEGGDESAGFAMYDMLRSSPCPIWTMGVGAVMSTAALIFQAGDHRQLTPECRTLVHNGSFSFGKGDIQQNHIIDYAKEMHAVNKRYAALIAERAGLPIKKVQGWCRGDKYFSAEEAVANGLADAIVHYPKKGKS
jgi:ATP-dependent Clp protease protease subunit